MTGGSNHGGPDQSDAASRLLPPRDGRETLSALLDGELPGDAARFALKRLSHDVQWRDTCGRWQLIGDALRGEASVAAPPDFATAVARALGAYPGAESEVATSAPAKTTAASRGRWLGGVALAASLAVAAVLVVKPFSPAPAGQPVPAVAGVAPAAAAPSTALDASALTGGGSDAATAVAPPPTPPRALRTARAVPRAAAGETSAPRTGSAMQVAEVAAATMGAPASGPFQPPVHDITTRPWPRAVLPGATAAGGFTVGLEGSSSSPEFYPFEPQTTLSPAQENGNPPPP